MNVYDFTIKLDWLVINAISKIDRFDASWTALERQEGDSLRQLKSIATVSSVSSSTRIEGSKMSDQEVDELLSNLSIDKLQDRDSQEVAGYFEVLEEISNSYEFIRITESEIKGLHNLLMKYNDKDKWHKGDYKQHSNNVDAILSDGSRRIVFQTTPPGFETDDAMRKLIDWYNSDQDTHPIVKSALFSYEFVSIHPFQDGNGRMSRLLASLSLLKSGYNWIQYISFEREIENRKPDYYKELRRCQADRPNEDVTNWILFYMECLETISEKLLSKLTATGYKSGLSPKEKSILAIISNYPGCTSGNIAKRLEIPSPTVKKLLKGLVENRLIEKNGVGRGTNYRMM